jgi:RNase P/RNase MRP subunit p29
MKSNAKTFIYQDMIGVILYAKHKYNPTWTEFRIIGKVVDETKFTLVVQNGQGIRIFIKNQYLFQSWIPAGSGQIQLIQFDGTKLVGLPEVRIKNLKKIRRKFH